MTKSAENINTLEEQARTFFERLFGSILEKRLGEIEIRGIPQSYMQRSAQSSFHSTIDGAVQTSFQFTMTGTIKRTAVRQ